MASFNVSIRGYADFHYPRLASLYNYNDEERTNLIRTDGARPLEN